MFKFTTRIVDARAKQKKMKREELVRSREYIISQIQLNLLNLVQGYKVSKNLKDYQLAEELGVSKGYISQILHATFDHKISKIVDLSLACNMMPVIHFVNLDDYVKADVDNHVYSLVRKKKVIATPKRRMKNGSIIPSH